MRRNFDLRAQLKDRRVVVRVVLGTLLAANLVAAVYVFHPWGGSAQDLIEQMHARERELAQQVQQLDRTLPFLEGLGSMPQVRLGDPQRAMSQGLVRPVS